MRVDESGRVTGFLEKPKTQQELDLVRMDPAWIDARGIPSNGRDCLASMGLYLFNKQTLLDALNKTDYEDFGKGVFPAAIRTRRVQLHLFDDYWEDIGTIRAFYEANLSLTKRNPPFDFSLPDAPIYSRPRFLPPTLLEEAKISNSLIADGCQIARGAVIENSIVGLRCVIGEGVTIRNSVLMGADFSQTEDERTENLQRGLPPIGIGSGSVIENAILDKNCRIGKNVRIVYKGSAETADMHEHCVVRDHLPIVIKDGILPDNWVLPNA